MNIGRVAIAQSQSLISGNAPLFATSTPAAYAANTNFARAGLKGTLALLALAQWLAALGTNRGSVVGFLLRCALKAKAEKLLKFLADVLFQMAQVILIGGLKPLKRAFVSFQENIERSFAFQLLNLDSVV